MRWKVNNAPCLIPFFPFLLDTYIGSVEKLTQSSCVYDEGVGFRTREITYVPGLFKIFDEILGMLPFLP